MPPTLFIKNTLRLASLGMGDGSVYGSASSATPNVSQKTFALTGFSWIADVGADADDKANGHFLYFPASGNKYAIVDWVAATDTATVYKPPAATDTGACEIRRGLVENKSAAGNPAFRLADGQVFAAWKGSAANQAQQIDISLPNLIGQGGFEELAAGAFPSAFSAKGKWYSQADWAVSATTPLIGSRMAAWTPGAADRSLLNAFSSRLIAGRKYRIILKAQAVTGATNAGAIQIYIENQITGTAIPGNFTGGNPWSLGAIGTSAAWFTSPDFIADSDASEARIHIISRVANKGAATSVRIDEVYFWEQVDVGALIVFGHNWEGMPSSFVYGANCSVERTGLTAGVDYATLANPQAAGSGAYLLEFTPAIYPIYRIGLNPFSLYAYEAAEIILAQKWDWKFPPELPDDAEREEYDESTFKTRSGVVTRILHSKRRVPDLQLKLIDPIDVQIWQGAFKDHHLDPGHPFAAKWTGNWGDRPVLFRSAEPAFSLPRRTPNYPDKKLEWEEVL